MLVKFLRQELDTLMAVPLHAVLLATPVPQRYHHSNSLAPTMNAYDIKKQLFSNASLLSLVKYKACVTFHSLAMWLDEICVHIISQVAQSKKKGCTFNLDFSFSVNFSKTLE